MRGNTLTGSLLFALVAAAGLVPYLLVTYPIVGLGNAAAAYHFAMVALYLAWTAPRLASGVRAGAAALLLLGFLGLVAPSYGAAVLGAALILAVIRSGLLYRSRPARALVLEGLLIGGGLFLGDFVGGATPLGMAASLWGFYLVQCLFFAVGGVEARPDGEAAGDPFERARARALAAMEDPLG